jgi:hypothetical protein
MKKIGKEFSGLTWVKIKIENRVVQVKFKFLLNVIIFLNDQEPEEKYRRISFSDFVVCQKESDGVGRWLVYRKNDYRIRT